MVIMFSTFLAVAVVICAVEAVPDETRLRHALFQNYDKWTRPVRHNADNLNVTMTFMPQRAVKFEHENANLHFTFWSSLAWKDYSLAWDPEEYNTTKIRVPSSMLWIPDIVPFGASFKVEPVFRVPAIVFHTGDVLYVPNYYLAIACGPTETADEFDCKENFGSWVYSGQELNPHVENEEIDLSTFKDIVPNPSVDLIGGSTRRFDTKYACCVETYPKYEMTLRIKVV